MLLVVNSMRKLSFGKLMEVYEESNQSNGALLAPEETPERQLACAEEDFYNFLRDVFFRTKEARYFIWEENGTYKSALRLEPYQDGWLLEGLETRPDSRRKGYAVQLIQAVQAWLLSSKGCILYSHVNKRNGASLQTHMRCSFSRFSDTAAYIDGSVNTCARTLVWKPDCSESLFRKP